MIEKVRYKDTVCFRFRSEKFDGSNWVFAMPDTYEAWLETAETTPQQLVQLPVEYGNDEYFYVKFYASSDTYSELKGGDTYYIAFYWTKYTDKLVDRILIAIVPDI